MGDIKDLILPGAVLPRLGATSKRGVLQALAEALAKEAGVDPRVAFDAVLLRERLSGTGMGDGVAIPHARIAGLTRPVGGFARLETPIDFDALDGRPADLIFMLLAPADRGADHLKALARVSRAFRRPAVRDRLRGARGLEDLQAVFESSLKSDAA
jgi:PTS system nitrogen regulatory IIA component